MLNLKIKIFTVSLSVFYIGGLYSSFSSHCVVLSFLVLLLLIFSIFKFNFSLIKTVILFVVFLLGIVRIETLTPLENVLSEIESYETIVTGKILTSKDIQDEKKRVRFYLQVNKAQFDNKTLEKLNSKVFVSLNFQNKNDKTLDLIEIGDTVEIKGKLRAPRASSNPYQFDYKKYLLNNDCENILYGELSDFKKISPPDDFKYKTLSKFEKTRNKILKAHSKNIKSPNLEVLGGIVFGNETINPDEKIKESFKNSGLLHLLAASGLNVALIFGIWWWIAQFIRFPYKLSILIGAVFIVFYTCMTGFPPSILRAGIMLLFVLFGKLIDRDADSVSLVFFAGFLILLFEPKMLFDVGFQLSFVVTFGLIVSCPVVMDKFKDAEKRYKEKYKNCFEIKKQFLYLFSPQNLICVVLVPLVAQLWVIPLQMHYFNSFSPYSVLANIVVVPFIGLLSFVGFIGSIIALVPYLNNFALLVFDSFANPFLTLLIKISTLFSSLKYSLINTQSLNGFQVFSFWAIILLFILNLKYGFKNRKHCYILLSVVILFSLSFIQINSNNLEISMFDNENADCFLIKTPKSRYIMIDTGKKLYHSASSFDFCVKNYILNKRIKNLEVLIITHFDNDHSGGAIDLLKTIKAKLVIIQKENPDTQTAAEILDYLKKNKINYVVAKNLETVYSEPDLTLKTLKPEISELSDNETSIVTLLTFKDKQALFMADMGVVGFSYIKKYLPKTIDILKIGHHGAKDVINEDMIDRLKPSYALVSAGSDRYNHPSLSTLILLQKKNIEIISTKANGYSKIIIDNFSNIEVEKFF